MLHMQYIVPLIRHAQNSIIGNQGGRRIAYKQTGTVLLYVALAQDMTDI